MIYFLGDIAGAIGYNSICIIIFLIAVLLGRRKRIPWILFAVGAFLQCCSFFGNFTEIQYGYAYLTNQDIYSLILFIVILVGTFFWIRHRRRT